MSSPEGIAGEFKKWGKLDESQVKELLEKAASKEMKGKLNSEAVKLVEEGGAFGAPWIVTERDGKSANWFGSDRTEVSLKVQFELQRDSHPDSYLPASQQIAAWLGKPYRGPMADGSVSASKL